MVAKSNGYRAGALSGPYPILGGGTKNTYQNRVRTLKQIMEQARETKA
jgi:hypothetical protein